MPVELQDFLAGVTLLDLITWATVLAGVFAALKWVVPFGRKVSHFIDDVAGEPARPGVPARPGLMERVTSIETEQEAQSRTLAAVGTRQAEHSKALATVSHEVTTNHGSSLKDAVKDMASSVDKLSEWTEKHEKKSDAIVARIDRMENP